MPLDCRLIIDDPSDGAWNMAVDEAVLEHAAENDLATLRLYQWAPTLSLGYFQSYADRAAHEPSAALPCVRRSSGGGALVHDRELTYSLTLPLSALAGRDTRALYCLAHKAVIATVSELGGDASRLSLCDPEKTSRSEEPFLCFLRRADGDLLVGEPHPGGMFGEAVNGRYKVCGSAQRKRHGGLLQHGGVLLARSPAAPELPGLAELGVLPISAENLAPVLARKLSEGIDLRLEDGELRENERASANRLRAEKHGDDAWVRKR